MSEDAPEKIAAKVMAIDIKITEEYEKVKDEPQKALEVLSKRLKLFSDARKFPTLTEYDSLLFGYVEGPAQGVGSSVVPKPIVVFCPDPQYLE